MDPIVSGTNTIRKYNGGEPRLINQRARAVDTTIPESSLLAIDG
tara:strand:+ start:35 stop:166 length:132 start_codon:yes stop_codon:yes gene_type:complete